MRRTQVTRYPSLVSVYLGFLIMPVPLTLWEKILLNFSRIEGSKLCFPKQGIGQ